MVAGGDQPPAMRSQVEVARHVAGERTDAYSAALWSLVPIVDGPTGPHVTFPAIVYAAIAGRRDALGPARSELSTYQPPDGNRVAVYFLTAWFLDHGYFRFSLAHVPVAQLFGPDPVEVSDEFVNRLSVSAAQFLSGYEEHDAERRTEASALAALAIKESMWGGPLPEAWI
jgi:hypothetical protein